MKRFVNFLVTLSIVLVMVLQLQVVVFAAGTGKNNAAEVKADNQINYGTISSKGTNDWYYIKTGSDEEFYYFRIHNESGTASMNLELYSARDEKILTVGSYTYAGDESQKNVKLLPNSTYYFKVYFNGGTGNYYFSVDKKVDTVGDTKNAAKSISVNEKIDSSIDGNGDNDYYVFTTGNVTQDYQVTLNNVSGTASANLYIYSERDEKLLTVGSYTYAGETANKTINLNANSTYYAVVSLNDGTGSYSFIISQCANGHTPADAWVTTKEPTCTDVGEKVKYCSVCNEVLETEQIKAKGHTFGEWKSKEPATWLSLGEKEAACEVCGEIETRKDWSKAWILPVIIIGAIALIIGIVNYIKSFKHSRY